jgi:hypothetical protein
MLHASILFMSWFLRKLMSDTKYNKLNLLSNGNLHFFPWVKQLWHEADHSPPSCTEVKNMLSYITTPQYIFILWCLIKQETSPHGVVLNEAQGQLYLYLYLTHHSKHYTASIYSFSCVITTALLHITSSNSHHNYNILKLAE